MRKSKKSAKNIIAVTLALIVLAMTLPVSAATTNSKTTTSTNSDSSNSATSNVTQSYNSDPSVQVGMIVKLKDKDPSTVVPLDYANIKDMLGVVVPASNATIVLTPQNVKQQQVLVATGGHYYAIVSNQNGQIGVGDYITISAIAGVGMKAGETENEVLGKAAGSFAGNSNVIGTVTLKNSLGKDATVSLGRIPIDINIAHNPLYQKSADYVPSVLAKAAVAVANKPVTAARIYLCLAILFITSVVTGNMLYSGIRSGMNAIGRNPLSKKSIIKSLIETVVAGLIIFIVGVFAVYLLLKL
jgi:hypothetical protein